MHRLKFDRRLRYLSFLPPRLPARFFFPEVVLFFLPEEFSFLLFFVVTSGVGERVQYRVLPVFILEKNIPYKDRIVRI